MLTNEVGCPGRADTVLDDCHRHGMYVEDRPEGSLKNVQELRDHRSPCRYALGVGKQAHLAYNETGLWVCKRRATKEGDDRQQQPTLLIVTPQTAMLMWEKRGGTAYP